MMVTVAGILILFSLLVIWHDKAPGHLSVDELFPLMISISETSPQINTVFAQIDLENPGAFYLVGIEGSTDWPVDMSRACYSDPLIAALQFRNTKVALAENIVAYRYRSTEDFIQILYELVNQKSSYLSHQEMHSWIILPVEPTDLSLKLIVAAALILSALTITATLKKTP